VKRALFLFLALGALACYAEEYELSSLLEELDAYLEWNSLREIGVILVDRDRVTFKPGVPAVIVNYLEKVSIDPPVRRNGGIYFTESAVAAIREALIRSRFQGKEEGFRVAMILIDPGHGGKDPGSVDDVIVNGKKVRILEKDVVLAVSRRLAALLSAEYPDKKILSTRSADTYPSLEERAEMGNSLLGKTTDSILYIAIHANRALNTGAKGFEIWYLPPEYKRNLLDEGNVGDENLDILPILNMMLEEEIAVESVILAREILAGMDARIGKLTVNRGLKEESFYVVRNAKMPAVLVEVGFLSNPEEGARLADEAYLKDVAEGIYDGIKSFIDRFEK
jgi:N-acetylmuramoyl-L-alanine amidase